MKIIVGLGNPGDEYKNTRHNVGFIALDLLREKLGFTDEFLNKPKFRALVCEGEYNDEKIYLVKPQTFMNLSGFCVESMVHYFKADINDLWIIHDDLDFETGTFKIRKNGSGGSHNGVLSVINHIKTEDFVRFRIGIEGRTPKQKERYKGRDYVLGEIGNDTAKMMKCIDMATDAALHAIEKGINSAMNKFN